MNYKELMREEREKAMLAMLLSTNLGDEESGGSTKKRSKINKSGSGKVERVDEPEEVDLRITLHKLGQDKEDIEQYRLKDSPAKDLFYIPCVLSAEDCQSLLNVVDAQKDYKGTYCFCVQVCIDVLGAVF